ncbi:TetR/AcrR family transcriptional regulator [Lentzea sp. BCCO 10_0061]|uniref:TetR/AcrR family transcriptional regulator n=1 Tax=Lentzea sokolovensis TaxID=3095429 RepID=A0ABU4V8H0_9PSEU|nr:TetR/AcrR family transcriptional regulator [Lentzea sp. BCCO 10_0061]MDX8148087.1 TetR/AcrR family transcriptional regulator [Lentzea sp. BCCO 10_0061]
MSVLPNRDRQAERREATRREIVDAAWEIARRDGLAAVTLREVAGMIGMRSPSLYSHFDSKNAIYDAMFGQAWTLYLAEMREHHARLPEPPRKAVLAIAEHFFAFSLADAARYQLLNQHAIPGFTPSESAYAPSVEVIGLLQDTLRGLGVPGGADVDLFLALCGGLLDRQLANEPGGDRWLRQLPRVIDMFADEVGLPGPSLRSSR